MLNIEQLLRSEHDIDDSISQLDEADNFWAETTSCATDMEGRVFQDSGLPDRVMWYRHAPWKGLRTIVYAALMFLSGVFVQPVLAGTRATPGSVAQSEPQPQRMPAIVVDVQGDVRHPGVYHLPADSRVQNAIQAAGGFIHSTDTANVNEAAPLDDGTEITIPTTTTSATSEPATILDQTGNAASNTPARVVTATINLNTATSETLQTLPSIGPGRANAIIAYRTQHGGFASVAELKKVHGIGKVIFGRVEPYLYVNSSAHNGQKQ